MARSQSVAGIRLPSIPQAIVIIGLTWVGIRLAQEWTGINNWVYKRPAAA